MDSFMRQANAHTELERVDGIVALLHCSNTLSTLQLGCLAVSFEAAKQIAAGAVESQSLLEMQCTSPLIRVFCVNGARKASQLQALPDEFAVLDFSSVSLTSPQLCEIASCIGEASGFIHTWNFGDKLVLDEVCAPALASAIQKCDSLRSVTIQSHIWKSILALFMDDPVRSYDMLNEGEDIDLSSERKLSPLQWSLLCRSLSRNTTVMRLSLGAAVSTMDRARTLVESICNHPMLVELDLASSGLLFLRSCLDKEKVYRWAPQFGTQLDLSQIPLSAESIALIMGTLRDLSEISTLVLGPHLTLNDAKQVVSIVNGVETIQNVSACYGICAMVGTLLNDAGHCKELFGFDTVLDLSVDHGVLEYEHIERAIRAMAYNNVIECVLLDGQTLTAEVVLALSECIRGHESVRLLSIKRCKFESGCDQQFAESVLHDCESLEALGVSEHLASSLECFTKVGLRLKCLDFSNSQLDASNVSTHTRVSVLWYGRRWYDGTVNMIEDNPSGEGLRYHIHYDDNDQRWYTMSELKERAKVIDTDSSERIDIQEAGVFMDACVNLIGACRLLEKIVLAHSKSSGLFYERFLEVVDSLEHLKTIDVRNATMSAAEQEALDAAAPGRYTLLT